MNLSKRFIKPQPVIGGLMFLTILSSVGAWVFCGDSLGSSSPPTSEEDHKEMKKWSSQLQDPSHENFNPFKREVNIWEWNHTPNEFGYKK